MLKEPVIVELADNVYGINEFGLSSVFIVVGTEKAAVIDTGVGTFDLKKTIRNITDLPYVVLLTHAHRDHCGGREQFDEIYVNKNDVYKFKEADIEGRTDYLYKMKKLPGHEDVWDVNESNLIKWENTPKYLDLEDGMAFDLGGRKITAIFTPGHSKGSCCFIDDKSKILFSGDALNEHLMVMDCPVETELNTCYILKKHESEFIQNYNGHLGYGTIMNYVSQPKSLLDDTIELCKQIMENRALIVESAPSKRFNGEMTATAFYKTVWLSYRVKQIFNNKQEV